MTTRVPSYRLSVYLPKEAIEAFVLAVSPHIPSFLGSYDHVCWWDDEGIEQSREKTQESLIQRTSCIRFECSLPHDDALVAEFIRDIVRPNHPWREPVVTLTVQDIVSFGNNEQD